VRAFDPITRVILCKSDTNAPVVLREPNNANPQSLAWCCTSLITQIRSHSLGFTRACTHSALHASGIFFFTKDIAVTNDRSVVGDFGWAVN
jgi:hypothetical protein